LTAGVKILSGWYHWLKRDAAPGVDGMTWDAYGDGLEARLRDLENRIHKGSYRAQPSLHAYIAKPDGRPRLLGIARGARLRHDAALEDKIVQRATVEVLNAIYETDCFGFSYGFRPQRRIRSGGARGRQAGDLRLPGLYPYLHADAAGRLSAVPPPAA
jgi:hypothetical protein